MIRPFESIAAVGPELDATSTGDGYDAQRGVLIDAKNYSANCPLRPGCHPAPAAGFRADIEGAARRQLAAAGPDRPIEWLIASEEASVYVSAYLDEIFRSQPALRSQITVITVLPSDIVP
jgi:hypothetical protein